MPALHLGPVLQPGDAPSPVQGSLNGTKASRGGCGAGPQEPLRGPQSRTGCPAPGPARPGRSALLSGRLVGGPERGLRLQNSASIPEHGALCRQQQGAWSREEAASRQICFQIKCYFFPLELSVELTLLLKNHQIPPCLDTDTFPPSPALSLSQP